MERLHENIGSGLTVLQAPAGFGKTTLIASFAADIEFETCWLTLDASSVYPEVFAAQLGLALLGETDGWTPATAVKSEDLKAYLASAVKTTADRQERPVLFVLDNIHELRDSPDATDLLGWVMEAAPEGWEFVLSGRAPAALVEVDRRIAAGECLFLSSTDLAFSQEEIGELLVRSSRANLNATRVAEATFGWPVGVMAVLNGMMNPELPGSGPQQAAWERYLVSEVWRSIPDETQRALLQISPVAVIEPELADAVLTPPVWKALRSWLGNYELLFETLDRGAIRLNPLLRSFLVQELERSDPERYTTALRQTVAWLEGRGQVHEAIELAREHRDEQWLAGLITRHGWQLLHQAHYALLARAFAALSPDSIEVDPFLAAIRAHTLARTNAADEAMEAAERVLANPAANANARMHAMLARIRALRLRGEREVLAHLFDEIREANPTADPAIASELAWQEAQTLIAITSDITRAERLLNQSIELARAAKSPTQELVALSSLGHLHAMRGDTPRAVNELTRAAQGWREMRGTSNLGWVLNNLGVTLQTAGDFEASLAVLAEARSEAIACENARTEAYATASLGDAEYALGHYAEGKVHYEEAIRISATEVLDESLASLSIAGLSACLLGLGDTQEAAYYAERAALIADHLGNPYEQGLCKLQLAMTTSANRNYAHAVVLSEEAIRLFTGVDARASLRVAYYRLAMFHFVANHRAEAHAALGQLAELIDEPWTVSALLPAVHEHPLFAQWVAARNLVGPAFREMIERRALLPDVEAAEPDQEQGRFPRVVAKSLGVTQVTVGGRLVTDETWASHRAKELFYLFLANRNGLRKEQAVEALFPEIPASKCNSTFHSNLYRIRKALYHDSVIKLDGAYVLNPEGDFSWDVDEFETALEAARELPAGSDDRATAYSAALSQYKGPFAEEFYSEWAATVRARTGQASLQALSHVAGFHAAKGQFEEAASCLERAITIDRMNPEAAYELATYRTRAGQAASALNFIDEYRRNLEHELGEELPPRLQTLRHRIATGAAV